MPDSILIPAAQAAGLSVVDSIVVRVPIASLPDHVQRDSLRFGGAVNIGGALWRVRVGNTSFSAAFPFGRGRAIISEPVRAFGTDERGRIVMEHSGAHVRAWDVPARPILDLAALRYSESWCSRFAIAIKASWASSLGSFSLTDLPGTGVDSREAFAASWDSIWSGRPEWRFSHKPIVWAIEGVVEPT